MTNIAPVGTALAGAAKTGQLDLAGNVMEMNLDWYNAPYTSPCNDCVNLRPDSMRSRRGAAFINSATPLVCTNRGGFSAASRYPYIGGRCARQP